jgi:hypothetical protein
VGSSADLRSRRKVVQMAPQPVERVIGSGSSCGGSWVLWALMVFSQYVDRGYDVGVEFGQVVGRNPVLQDGFPSSLLSRVSVKELLLNLEPGDEAGSTGLDGSWSDSDAIDNGLRSRISGRRAVEIWRGNVRVIINESAPIKSTAMFQGGGGYN